MELMVLAALGSVATYLGISDWKKRTVDLRGIIACYDIAACVNAVIIFAGAPSPPDGDISWHDLITISPWLASIGQAAMETVHQAAGSILTVLFLSGTMFAFHRLGLLASGDALAVPAMLAMLTLVARPMEIVLYFVAAMVFVLVASVSGNMRNNLRHRGRAYGALWNRLYLMLLCYYGDGETCRYAFRYSGSTRRDYDGEKYYEAKEKTWLVPGLPLLSGFAPATLVLLPICF